MPEPKPPKFPAALLRRLRRLWLVDLRGVRLALNPRLRRPARYLVSKRTIELRAEADTHVLIHELAHAAAVELHGRNVRPHGKEWRALVEAAGAVQNARPSQRRKTTRRYAHTCPVCQFHRAAGRPVTTWRCPDCVDAGLAGGLEITRIR